MLCLAVFPAVLLIARPGLSEDDAQLFGSKRVFVDGILNRSHEEVRKSWGEPHLKEVFQGSTTHYYTLDEWEDTGSRANNATDFTARDVFEVTRSSVAVRYALSYLYTQDGFRRPLVLRVGSYSVSFRPAVSIGALIAVFPEFKPAVERSVEASFTEVPTYRKERSRLLLAVREPSSRSMEETAGILYTLILTRGIQAPERPRVNDLVSQVDVAPTLIYLENRGEFLKDYLDQSEAAPVPPAVE